MATPSWSSQRVRFGEFELDLSTCELWFNGSKQTLAPQPFQVLELLIKHRGQLVTRDDLVHHLWPSDTFVDYEQGLKKAVKRLRETLNDSADEPRFIENLPRQGYRFIAEVQVDTNGHDRAQATEPIVLTPKLVSPRPEAAPPSRGQMSRSSLTWMSGLVLIFIATAWFVVFPAFRAKRWKPSSPEIMPLVTLPGVKATPSISPDGTEIAFAYQAEGSSEMDIYIKGMEDDRVTRLTSSSGESIWPSLDRPRNIPAHHNAHDAFGWKSAPSPCSRNGSTRPSVLDTRRQHSGFCRHT